MWRCNKTLELEGNDKKYSINEILQWERQYDCYTFGFSLKLYVVNCTISFLFWPLFTNLMF